jgi:hypothetical protein
VLTSFPPARPPARPPQRYRICVLHAGAQVQEVDGKPCQWCQQVYTTAARYVLRFECHRRPLAARARPAHLRPAPAAPQCGRFHALDAFDEGRRTCRVRLTRHAVQKTKRKRSNAVAARGPGPARAGRGTRIDEEEEEEAEQSVSDASSLDPDDGLRAVLPPALHNALRATARESRDSRDAWQGPAARSAFGAFGGSGNGAVHALETAAAEAEHEAPGPAPAPYRPRPVHASCWPAPPPLPPPLPLPPPASAAELLLMLLTSILST